MLGLLGVLESVSSHRMLDRLIRGRMWIGIVAFALLGIVTLQLGLLKLNSSIGRSLEKQSVLQRENAALSIENSELSGGDRVESEAQRLGMRLVAVGGLHFLSSHAGGDVPRAVQALKTPAKAPEASSETSPSSTEGASQEESSPGSGGASEASSESSSHSEETQPSTSAQSAPAGEHTESSSESPASETGATATGTGASAPATAEGGTAAPGG